MEQQAGEVPTYQPPLTLKIDTSDFLIPVYFYLSCFEAAGAAAAFASENAAIPQSPCRYERWTDEAVCDTLRRANFAAHRWHRSTIDDERSRWAAEYIDLRNRIVEAFAGLAFKAAGRCRQYFKDTGELEGDAFIYLIEATRHFDPWRGQSKFITYASQALWRGLGIAMRKHRCRETSVDFGDDDNTYCHPAVEDDDAGHKEAVRKVRESLSSEQGIFTPLERDLLRWKFGVGGEQIDPREIQRRLGVNFAEIDKARERAFWKLRFVTGMTTARPPIGNRVAIGSRYDADAWAFLASCKALFEASGGCWRGTAAELLNALWGIRDVEEIEVFFPREQTAVIVLGRLCEARPLNVLRFRSPDSTRWIFELRPDSPVAADRGRGGNGDVTLTDPFS